MSLLGQALVSVGASLDMTALAAAEPNQSEIAEGILKDKRPDAYPRLAERLLASPQFGERLASLWLPLARYAEEQAHQVGNDTKMVNKTPEA